MALEDFFTLTEMKDGLTSLSRVNELVAVMQKERDSVIKNASEATRQWSTVANAIAATENKDCLDLFIQLDGIGVIDNWLKDANKFGDEVGDGFVGESISALLKALEKMPIDSEKLVSSGIWNTVKNLVDHSSSVVCDGAKTVLDHWNQIKATLEVKRVDLLGGNGKNVNENTLGVRISPSKIRVGEINSDPSIHTDSVNPVKVDEEQSSVVANNLEEINNGGFSNSFFQVGKNPLAKQDEDDPTNPSEAIGRVTQEGEFAVQFSESAHEPKQRQDLNSLEKEKNVSSSFADVAFAMEYAPTPKEDDDDSSGQTSSSNASNNSYGYEHKFGEVKESTESGGDKCHKDSDNGYDSSKHTVDAMSYSMMSKRSGDEIDYSMIDPLEFARQVAIEIEREVDCRQGQSCSNSNNSSGHPIGQHNNESPAIEGPLKEGLIEKLSPPSKAPSPSEPKPIIYVEPISNAEGLGAEHCVENNLASSQLITDAAEESEANVSKSVSGFDLNQEDFSDDIDRPLDPISVAYVQFEGTPSGLGKRLDDLDFDLNISEETDEMEDQTSEKQKNLTESFVEGKSERIMFDLNCGGEDCPEQNGCLTPGSSSSASIQPSVRNFDLNDNLAFVNDSSSDYYPHPGNSMRNAVEGTRKANESVISIFGSQFEVNTRDFFPRKALEPEKYTDRSSFSEGILGMNSAVPYAQAHFYRYNGLAFGHNLPFSATMYGPPSGPIPYVMDSRGGTSGPQFIGSGLGLGAGPANPLPFSQPWHFMTTTAAGSSSGPDGVGPSAWHDLDLNSGSMTDRETSLGLRQPLNLIQGGPLNEQLKLDLSLNEELRLDLRLPSYGSVVGVKRQEPESGYDPYQLSVKYHHQPPWQ